jgi:hypothetical protein
MTLSLNTVQRVSFQGRVFKEQGVMKSDCTISLGELTNKPSHTETSLVEGVGE